MNDVAVRDQVIRSSADLPADLRKVLDSVPVGELTAARSHPVTASRCSRSARKNEIQGRYARPHARRARRSLTERFEQQSKKYLRQLRSSAMIEPGK